MAVEITMELKGAPELAAKLRSMPKRFKARSLRAIAWAGAKEVRQAIKGAAPRGPVNRWVGRGNSRHWHTAGTLARSIYQVRSRSGSNEVQEMVIVGVLHGKKYQSRNRDAYYGGWVEKGHKIVPRTRRGSAASRLSWKQRRGAAQGSVPPHPFFEPTFRATSRSAVDEMLARAEKEVVQQLMREGA